MPAFKDLTSKIFERLTVIELHHRDGRAYWLCRCSCGNEKILDGSRLTKGNDRSCGCLRNEMTAARMKRIMPNTQHHLTHGMSGTRFYTTYRNMMSRCYDRNRADYSRYGSKGISVDLAWHDFNQFHADMCDSYVQHVKRYTERNTTLDRVDGTKGYSKGNCRWATYTVQNNNRNNNVKRRALT